MGDDTVEAQDRPGGLNTLITQRAIASHCTLAKKSLGKPSIAFLYCENLASTSCLLVLNVDPAKNVY